MRKIIAFFSFLAFQGALARDPLERYDVVWKTPSLDAAGSMPMGSGEVGLNVWMEPTGDLLFYVSRTDAWSEGSRLLKLGRVRLHFSPNPCENWNTFCQQLRVANGYLSVSCGDINMMISAWKDRISVSGITDHPIAIQATLETFRPEARQISGGELVSSWTMRDSSSPISESADQTTFENGQIVLRHHNSSSIVPQTLQLQGLSRFAHLVEDPILGYTLQLSMAGHTDNTRALSPLGNNGLQGTAAKSFRFEFDATRYKGANRAPEKPFRHAAQDATDSLKWWKQFWDRSYILVSGSTDAERVTRAYMLQRYMNAIGGRGEFPIKFNGSMFTVEPKALGEPYNADWRRWGDCFWWQNTRLPYHPMIAAGDLDLMDSLFDFYLRCLPISRARAKFYYGAEGTYFPETMTPFGTYSNGDYGWSRSGLKPGDVQCPWWQWAWNQGPELVALMLDRYEQRPDRQFLEQKLWPMSEAVLDYFESRFLKEGRLTLSPTQAVETYWNGVVDDTPSVAGLHNNLPRLLKLPPSKAWTRSRLRKLLSALPPVALASGRIAPAAQFNPERSNVENPEFYAIWPFRLFGVGRPQLEIAQKTYRERIEKANAGWQYDGQVAALCGLTEDAKASLLSKIINSNPAYRWPATWGPNYDWLPDQCHGGNIMSTLQAMALQEADGKLYLLPAWPPDWDVSLKLHASRNTVVTAVYRRGKLESATVTPKSRQKDLVLPSLK